MKYCCLNFALLLVVSCSDVNFGSIQHPVSVNEVGYLPNEPKLAFLSSDVGPDEIFHVVDAETGQVHFESVVEMGLIRDRESGDVVHTLDFSDFKKTGQYRLSVPGQGYMSSPFQIGKDVYNTAVISAMESFFYQRCGIEKNNGTPWSHPACHLDDAAFFDDPGERIDVTGGWHDAGDYAKFIVTTAVSAAFKLYLYEQKPDHFSDRQLHIPESGNGLPDLLDEIQWGLRWMLRMQNEEGGVYFKVSEKRWTGEYLPHEDPDNRYIFEVSSTATANLAAVSALASRVYESHDPVFSNRLRKAAEKAWEFLQSNPDIIPAGGFKNPPDVQGGEYADNKDLDERLWASVELYGLTGSKKYHNWFLDNYRRLGGPQAPPVSWQHVAGFSWYSYLRMPQHRQNGEARSYIMMRLTVYADSLLDRIERSGYRIVLNFDEYYWGSNSVVLGYAFDLIQAYEFIGLNMYKRAALDQLHYILGRNPFGISYVTGVGYNSVQNPYHQFSMRLNHSEPVPGMVTGGPNSSNRLNGVMLSEYPARAYEDRDKNYMVNETAINYTAPLIYLAGYFSDFNASPVTTLYQN